MSEVYHIYGETLRLGREKELGQIRDAITKDGTDNLMVVGPKLIGKTTLLKAIPTSIDLESAGYVATVFWNLGHETPKDDDDFRRQLMEQIKSPLLRARRELSDWFSEDQKPIEAVDGALDELEEAGERLLLIMDTFDYVLKRSSVTRSLWDNLADLFDKKAITVVTGSHLPLRELCGDEITMNSEVWKTFDSVPLRLGPFPEDDMPSIFKPLADKGFSLDQAAQSEIVSQTGGVPVLCCALLQFLEDAGVKAITSKAVQQAAQQALDNNPSFLSELWSNCGPDEQSTLVRLAEHPDRAEKLPHERQQSLLQRGFVTENRKGLRGGCGIMLEYASRFGNAVEDMKRIFGDAEDYCSRIKEVLEFRLGHLSGVDQLLLGFVQRTLRDLDADPVIPVYDMRGIAERAIALVIEAEFPEGQIPAATVQAWQFSGVRYPLEENRAEQIPEDNGRRADLLLLLTGDKKARVIPAKARFISKGTALLISHLWTIGRAGVHRDEGHVYGPLFAGSACFAAVELCEHLSRELPSC